MMMFVYGLSCKKAEKKDIPEPVAAVSDPALEVFWQVRADSGELGSFGREPLIWGDKLIWSNARYAEGFEVILTDATKGTELWRWQDFIKYRELPYQNFHFIANDHYYLNNIQETHCIDLSTGQTAWQDYNANAGAYISLAGDHLYGKLQDQAFKPNTCILRRTGLGQLGWESILQVDKEDNQGFSPAIFGPSLWLAPGGDSVLIFQNRSWNFNLGKGRIDLCAFDLNAQTWRFVIKDIEPTGNSNVLPPLVDGHLAYLVGAKNLHCVDLQTGKVLWQKGFPGRGHHLMLSNLVIDGSMLVVKSDDDRIYGFDKVSGRILWDQSDAGGSPSHMKLCRGVVYYTSDSDGKLYGVKTATGEILCSSASPNQGKAGCPLAGFHSGVAVSEELGLIFAHDHHYMMAIKMPGLP